MIFFCETLGLWRWLLCLLAGRRVFYLRKSFAVRLGESLSKKLGIETPELRELAVGSVDVATGIQQAAWANARTMLDGLQARNLGWAKAGASLFKIDFGLIVDKFLFDELYRKYRFIELALAYRQQNPGHRYRLCFDSRFLSPYYDRIAKQADVRIRRQWNLLAYLAGVAAIPAVLLLHACRYRAPRSISYTESVICLADDASTLEMFSSIFGRDRPVQYVVERHNAARLAGGLRPGSPHVAALGLTSAGLREMAASLPGYMQMSLRHGSEIARFGFSVAGIFHTLLHGRAEAIEGERNSFVCFEHFTTVKAVRNEFLRSRGNSSIFISKNCYVTYQQFHSELFVNYSAMCVSGPHALDVYARREVRTRTLIRSGSYDVHRSGGADRSRLDRVRRLSAQKGAVPLVVFLSPGLCEDNLSHDKRLIELAAKLGQRAEMNVMVRMKPATGIPGYREFYERILEAAPQVRLTGAEFDLFDFIEVADLFVTSQSTSACDLASAGAQVMFIDFMKTPDVYAPWEKVPGTVFQESAAMDQICRWVADTGRERERYAGEVGRLAEYLAYRFDSFEAYRTHLLEKLIDFLPPAASMDRQTGRRTPISEPRSVAEAA